VIFGQITKTAVHTADVSGIALGEGLQGRLPLGQNDDFRVVRQMNPSGQLDRVIDDGGGDAHGGSMHGRSSRGKQELMGGGIRGCKWQLSKTGHRSPGGNFD